MMKIVHPSLLAMLIALGCGGCHRSADTREIEDGGSSDSDSGTDTDTGSGTEDICDEQDIPLTPVPIRLMLLLDRSSSIQGAAWTQAKSAIQGLLDLFDDDAIEFGLDYYPDPTSTSCATWAPVVLDCAPGQQEAIMDELNAVEPVPSTPLYCALDNFNEPGYTPLLTDNAYAHYVVLISDGDDSCTIDCDGGYGSMVTPDLLAGITQQLVEIGTKVIVISFPAPWNAAHLLSIAQNGGTEFTEFLIAEDEASLQAALDSVVNTVYSCVYNVDEPNASANPDWVDFYFDGELVLYVEDCSQGYGWTWHNENHTQVEFCGAACDQLKDGEVDEIVAAFDCYT
jgi:hypothetical protein